MKNMLTIFFLTMCIAVSANAGPVAYIGLYVDDHMTCETSVIQNVPFSFWMWVLPSDSGVICFDNVDLNMHPSFYNIATSYNPEHTFYICENGGYCMCFTSCQYDWAWLVEFSILPVATVGTGYIEITGTPGGDPVVATCEEGFPEEPLRILNHLAYNQPCQISTENKSWGSIKSMYKD